MSCLESFRPWSSQDKVWPESLAGSCSVASATGGLPILRQNCLGRALAQQKYNMSHV